jgi:hypothetical protein
MRKLFLPILFIFVFVTGCEKTESCTSLWFVNNFAVGASNIFIDEEQFELSVQFNNWSGLAAEIFQDNIGGNFSVIADYRNWQTGTASAEPYFALTIWDPTLPDTILDTTIVEVGLMRNRLYSMTELGDTTFRTTNSTEGSLRLTRAGNSITAIAIAGIDTAFATGTYIGKPRRIGFRIGTKDSTKVSFGTTGIKIPTFEVVNTNGSIVRDDFNCNSFR